MQFFQVGSDVDRAHRITSELNRTKLDQLIVYEVAPVLSWHQRKQGRGGPIARIMGKWLSVPGINASRRNVRFGLQRGEHLGRSLGIPEGQSCRAVPGQHIR